VCCGFNDFICVASFNDFMCVVFLVTSKRGHPLAAAGRVNARIPVMIDH